MFEALMKILGPGETLRFEIAAEGEGDTVTVMVQPILKAAPATLTDEQLQLRAGLAHPLRLSGSATQLDAELLYKLQCYGEKRRELHKVADDMAELDEALRQAQQNLHGKRKKAAKTSQRQSVIASNADDGKMDESAPTTALPASTTNTNPDSLF